MTDDLRLRFLEATREEDPALAASLTSDDADVVRELGGVLGRLLSPTARELDARARLAARRILGPLRRRDGEALTILNKTLDYLDLDANGRLDEKEIDLAARCIEAFAELSKPGLSLSMPELRTLYGLLRAIDSNDDHRLDGGEQGRLDAGLRDLAAFIEQVRQSSPDFSPEI